MNGAKNKDVGFRYPVCGTVLISLFKADNLPQDFRTRSPDLYKPTEYVQKMGSHSEHHRQQPSGGPSRNLELWNCMGVH